MGAGPRHVSIPGAQLHVRDWGVGEAVVFVPTAITADELLPLARDAALTRSYRKIVYHRRGYGGSRAVDGAASIPRDADDCRELLSALGIERAHVVGASYSAAIALQLAADAPELVRSLVLMEPPPVITASAADFRAATDELSRQRRELGPCVALEKFLSQLIGADWRAIAETHVPGAADQIQRDATTFFDADVPALLAWRFDRADAERITCPVAHIGGRDSGPWFAEVRQVVRRWFPHARDVVIPGADHNLALTHTRQVADALVAFLASTRVG